ncbi:MAG: UDPGP type 1 family protein [Planctomycetales bacterium]|nr:UDPGP type 1 family protein [Planctomycetales bacterium]
MLEHVRSRLREFGQEHLLRWWNELDDPALAALLASIDRVDFALLGQLFQQSKDAPAAAESLRQKARRATPPAGLIRQPRSTADKAEWQAARDCGAALLTAGRVGAILVAGGQGTRLDFPHPKGMFPIGPVSGKSLFQLLAEQLLARGRRAGVTIPYYIMTSDATHDETVDFFRTHNSFGLDPNDVRFFQQGSMPAVDATTGRVLLAGKGELSQSPDGHGGMLSALASSGLLDDMRKRGIESLYYHQVDNPLARVCDPEFLGFHSLRDADVSVKVVAKRLPREKMGVAVDVDGQTQIIEYSDLPDDVAAQRDDQGEIRFWAGSTAIHVFSRTFIQRLVDQRTDLPFHIARKQVSYLDDAGQVVMPATENAFKFERFIFDVLPLARKTLVVEADRETEFNPLKNKTGEFSPPDVQRSLMALHRSWLRVSGVDVADDVAVEINPLFALGPEDIAARLTDLRQIESALAGSQHGVHVTD